MNLIICCTNLQVLIAKRIIELSNEKHLVIVLCFGDKDKGTHYYNLIEQKCEENYFISIPSIRYLGRIWGFVKVVKYCRSFSVNNFKKCYLASVDNDYVQLILSKISFDNLFTFDDGTANINPNSIYYNSPSYSILHKLLRKVFGIKYDIFDLKNNSKLHYSIYKKFDNIVDEVEDIDLFNAECLMENTKFKTHKYINYYIGQPLHTLNHKYDTDHILELINDIQIDFYYPHPNEDVKGISMPIVKTPLIFEEYIVKKISSNPSIVYRIYSFGSTVLFNIIDFPNVELYYLYDSKLENKLSNIYKMYDKIGINKIIVNSDPKELHKPC
jgi:beta-galactosamide-alpha-2,3-sialyltransferase